MKKSLFLFLILAISASFLSFGSTAMATTTSTSKTLTLRTSPAAKKPVIKVASKVKVATIKTPTKLINGVVGAIDYDKKIFTLKTKDAEYTVITTGKTYVSVPGVRRGTSVYNIAIDMQVKVAGAVDKDTMTIQAKTVYLVYTHLN